MLSLVGEARNGPDAVELIRAERPDLVFLDVQMPELDGFGVLEALEGEPLPAVVFVTAYDEYAIRAFDVHAVDYLLKPFDEERFRLALGRVRSRLGERRTEGLDERIEAVLSELRSREQYADRLLVKGDGRVTVLQVDEVDWIEAADNYARVHTCARAVPGARAHQVARAKAEPKTFCPSSSLGDREPGTRPRASANVRRRVRDHSVDGREVDAESRVPGRVSRSTRQRVVRGARATRLPGAGYVTPLP